MKKIPLTKVFFCTVFFAAMFLMSANSYSQGALATYSFGGTVGCPVGSGGYQQATVPAAISGWVSFLDYTRGAGLTCNTTAGAFLSSGWSSTIPTSVSGNDYHQFGLNTITAGRLVTLTSISITHIKSNAASTFELRSSLDGYVTTVFSTSSPTTVTTTSIPLPATFANLTAPVTFRLYITASNATHTWSNDNVIINGVITPVSSAGSSQSICSGSLTLAANNVATTNSYPNPPSGVGTWSVFSGPNTSSAQFLSTTTNNTTFTPAGGSGTYVLRWTVTHSGSINHSSVTSVSITVSTPVTPPALTLETYDLFGSPLGNNPTICQFQSVDFYVQTPFESSEPKTFRWKKNGVIQFTQTSTNPSPPGIAWNSSTLVNGDVVTLTVVFTSPPPCYSPDSVTSQNITFTVTPNQPPTITVSDNSTNDTICRGSTIIFTANPLEAGTPTYEWRLDGNLVGGNNPTYTTLASLTSGNHQLYCIITSGEACDSQDPVFNPVVFSDTTFFYVDPCFYYVPVSGVLGTHYTCGAPFYDSQNDLSVPYVANVNGKTTFCPATAGDYITISLSQLRLGTGDTLRIYNSSTTAGDITTYPVPLVTYFGPTTTTPACNSATIANVSSGCLTAWFKSNATSQDSGWKATITCSPTPSPGPLAGSTCANPTLISGLPYAVTGHTTLCYGNDYATTTCLTGYNGEDHIYEYTATGPECTSITMSGASGNPTLAVYLGCPTAGSCITPAPLVGNTSAQVTFPSAGTYYIIVDGTSGSSTYNLSILSFGIAPDNDLPCNAQFVDLSVNVNGNNTCTGAASEPGNASCWGGGALNTNWFSFIAPASGSVRIRTTGGSIGSTQIALYSGTCSSLTQVACNVNGPSCAGSTPTTSSEIAWSGLTSGATYFVRVDGTNNQTGNYSLIVVDQTGPQPYVDGQDCISPMTVCNNNFTVGNPGFLWNGWICDYPSANGTCMSAGERSSAWYVINISGGGNFTFALSPLGSTDYDWVLFDITGLGSDVPSRLTAACAQINSNNLSSWVRCNWSAPQTSACGTTYQTGMCTALGNASAGAGGPSFSSAYPVTAGKTLLLNLSNFTQNATGFSINFNNNSNTSPITYSNPPSVLYWTAGANNTDWFNPVNWGNCGPPNCNTTAVITTGSSFMPVINTNTDPTGMAVCRDLDIKAGASVTINAGIQLDICRNYTNNGSLNAAATSTVRVMGTGTQYFDGNMIGTSAFGNLWMNKTSNHMTILDHARVAGTLTLGTVTGGKIITGNKIIYSINTAPGSVTSGGPGSYVEGFLRRNLTGTAGTYYWPVGTAAKGFQLAATEFYGTHSIGNILGYFTGTAVPIQPGPLGPECPTNDFTTMAPLNNGYWTMTADANASSATYKMTLYNLNYTNSSGANAWTVLKANTAVGPWTLNGNCTVSTVSATARDNMTGFSVFTSGQSGAPLPVELLTFTANLENTGVAVNWQTASEINNDYFDIERSRDGEHFEKIGTKKGAGNSTVNLYYSLFDSNPYSGINYYRLKQVDFNGTYKYSDKVYVVVNPEAGMVSVYPNPAQTDLWCDFYTDGSGRLQFEIMDVLGKTYSTEIRDAKKGLNEEVKFNIGNLPQGVYFIRVKTVDGSNIIPSSQMRFVKQMREE